MRPRDRILQNLESIYRESFDRAKEAADEKRMADLDNAYMRDQLMLEILLDLSSYIEVPGEKAAERRTFPTPAPEIVNGKPVAPLIRIFSSSQTPSETFAAVPYGREWYWIDDRDFPSKKLFSFIMFLFTLTETEGKPNAPLITIPVG